MAEELKQFKDEIAQTIKSEATEGRKHMEMKFTKFELSQKISREEFVFLENRVAALENKGQTK